MSDEFNPNNNDMSSNNNMNNNDMNSNNNSMNQGNNNTQYSFWAEQVSTNQQNENAQSNTNSNYYSQQENSNSYNDMNANQYSNTNPYNNTDQYNNANQYSNTSQYNNTNQYREYNPNYGNISNNNSNPNGKRMRRERSANSKGSRAFRFVGKAICGGVIAGACFLGVNAIYSHFNDNVPGVPYSLLGGASNSVQQLSSTTVLDDAVVPETDVTEVYKDTLPAIVAIDSTISQTYSWFGQTYNQDSTGSGSGIIVSKTDTELLIVTNNHVVDGASKIMITFINGEQAEAVTKGTDSSYDLAVVAIDLDDLSEDILNSITIATLGDSDQVKEGEMAIAIGNALGYGQSITVGYVSALNRTVEFDTGSMELLQTDAAINPGNSGGALLNINGEVIGINCAKLAEESVEGMGYAIPISKAIPIINELMSREIIKEEDQGYLGVSIMDITEDISTMYNMPIGVYVRGFTDDSAAEEAGILTGDIITAIDGVEATTSTSLKEKVISYKYGTEVTVTLKRSVDGSYEEMKVKVVLGRNTSSTKSSDSTDNQNSEQDSSDDATIPDNNREDTTPDNSIPNQQLPNSPSSGSQNSGN